MREGFIEKAEFLALREALPERLKDPITFLWLTGWRLDKQPAQPKVVPLKGAA